MAKRLKSGKLIQITYPKFLFQTGSSFLLGIHEFEDIAKCIDQALDKFGLGTRNMIYLRLKSESNFSRDDITYRPEEFKRLLEIMFPTGSKLFQRTIVKEIAGVYGTKLESNFDLVGAIQQAKTLFSSKASTTILA